MKGHDATKGSEVQGIFTLCDSDGVLCTEPCHYIDKMMESYQHMFGSKPLDALSPLEKGGDHPELDASEELNADGIRQYQLLN